MRLPSYWPYLGYLISIVLFLAAGSSKWYFVLVAVVACLTGINKEIRK